MAQFYYNSAFALNNKPSYGASDILDFEVKMRPGRSMVANSFRVNGILQISKTLNNGLVVPIEKSDNVFVNAYTGVHAFFRNSSVLVNGSVVENNSYYPRWCAMQKQKGFTLEGLNTSSDCLTEMCGTQNNILLLGSNTDAGCSFSMKPCAAINGSSSNLPQSQFPSVRIVFNMVSPLEALYTTHKELSAYMISDKGFTGLTFTITNLHSMWYETNEIAVPQPVTFQTASLVTTTLATSYAVFALTAANLYDAVSLSFIQQSHRNSLFFDNNLSEFIPGLDTGVGKLEVTLDGNSAVVTYPIQSYADAARNYAKSLGAGLKNSITNAYLSKVLTFGLGFRFAVAENDRIALALQVDPTVYNPSETPCDVFQYLSGYVQV